MTPRTGINRVETEAKKFSLHKYTVMQQCHCGRTLLRLGTISWWGMMLLVSCTSKYCRNGCRLETLTLSSHLKLILLKVLL